MKAKSLLVAVVVGGVQVSSVHAGFLDSVLNGASQSRESSPPQDYQSGRHEHSGYRPDDRNDYHEGEGGRGHSGRQSSDPDVIVKRAYEDILNREPDTQGLRLYRSKLIDENWSEQDVRAALRKSAEYNGKTPASADVVIRRAYQDILGRDPDEAGLKTYRAKLLNEGWSERDVRSELQKSAERRVTGGMSREQAQQMVRRAYQSVLGRDPDDSGSNTFVQKIMQSHWSEADVAKELRNSQEYRQKHKK